ncbi:Tat pathway signal sequence domain-containing protein [Arthrobacter crystallopoietes BAB-32]|uniref:Tat pathway signal sequence domain-containing protein n=1 Tax=Arthrobacter crystallopoietes BAB-32 TaxID=1246476 RepID=N1V5G4_9MICC|nr:multicopper oxidase domain-containing protein [Arthrobacter crystallopoietes]EMY35307.1 Tat pathway signal sequence domain-containing protein [Arthrobacter crystallopoietes BAB-32]
MGNEASSPMRLLQGAATATQPRTASSGSTGVLDLYINEGFVPMVDGSLVYHRGFGDRPSALADPKPSLRISPRIFTRSRGVVASRTYPLGRPLPHAGRPLPAQPTPTEDGYYLPRRQHWASYFPDRTIIAEAGSTISLRIHNRLSQPHELAIQGVKPGRKDATTGPIAPGKTKSLTLPAPAPGTYVYLDPTNAPVERTLGLFGALVVIDPARAWHLGPKGPEFERQWLWICHDVVPEWAQVASQGGTVRGAGVDIAPRYFTLNDHSGFESLAISDDEELNERREEDTLPSGFPRLTDVRNFSRSPKPGTVLTGQLIRMLNVGIVDHQLHFHGNHVWSVRANGFDFPRKGGRVMADGHVALQQWEDTVSLMPLERKEAILPMFRPPDVIDAVWDARREDWKYPMHCHAEPSQTAAGGLYPGGLLADWTLAATEEPDEHHKYESQVDFASDQPHEGSPETLFRQRPDESMVLDFFSRKLDFPDKSEHEVWSFHDEESGEGFPGPSVRVREGQVFHGTIEPSKRVHTIHWHGLEPDPRNDGVGHTSSRSPATTRTSGGRIPVCRAIPAAAVRAHISTTATSIPRCTSKWECSARSSSIRPST